MAAKGKAEPLRYLTVVTYGRTGSTAIQASLNALPGVLVRGENYAALRGMAAYLQSVAETADRHHAGRPDHPWFGSARLDPVAVLADQRRHVVEFLLRPRADTRWIGFKEVRYEPGHFADYDQLLDYLLFLSRLLPGIAYVVNTRDPGEAAQSGWWTEHGDPVAALALAETWLQQAAEDLDRLLPANVGADTGANPGEHRAVHVRHEQWSRDPQILIEAYARLGLPADDAAVRSALAEQLDHGRRA